MRLIQNADEIDLYSSSAIQPLIDFKWDSYGKRHHLSSLIVHFIHMIFIVLYVKFVYVENGLNDCLEDCNNTYALGMLFGNIYVTFYELYSLFKEGMFRYFTDG